MSQAMDLHGQALIDYFGDDAQVLLRRDDGFAYPPPLHRPAPTR